MEETKTKEKILEQLEDLENAYIKNDVEYNYYKGYKNALNWVLKRF